MIVSILEPLISGCPAASVTIVRSASSAYEVSSYLLLILQRDPCQPFARQPRPALLASIIRAEEPQVRHLCWHNSSTAAKKLDMGVAITVRDVPDDVRDELAARAARAGKSLQEYLRAMLVDATARPPVGDVIARARARVDVTGARVAAEAIVAARDADRR